MKRVVVSSGLDHLNSIDMRFLEEASKLGELHVLLWSDEVVRAATSKDPKFPLAERQYFISAIRYVHSLQISSSTQNPGTLPEFNGFRPDIWAVDEANDSPEKKSHCAKHGIEYCVIQASDVAGFPEPPSEPPSGKKKVVVTGCYDWFHSGHVRFFEEVSELGDLFVVVGNDKNVGHLKGADHPMFKEQERRYVAGSIRYVKQALISTGMGWMDAEPEIEIIKPDMYAVNEDGDKPEKLEFCKKHGIQYVVLKRTPKEGLSRRSSTDLRGF